MPVTVTIQKVLHKKEPKANTHFTTVTVLYFNMSGFTITIYIAHEIQFTRISISPTNEGEPVEIVLLPSSISMLPLFLQLYLQLV